MKFDLNVKAIAARGLVGWHYTVLFYDGRAVIWDRWGFVIRELN